MIEKTLYNLQVLIRKKYIFDEVNFKKISEMNQKVIKFQNIIRENLTKYENKKLEEVINKN